MDKVEGERKWDLKEVEQGTEESVREAIAFFDEMDDLVGLVRFHSLCYLLAWRSFDPARSSLSLYSTFGLASCTPVCARVEDGDQLEVRRSQLVQVVPSGRCW